jgi:hypothetical protein
LIVRIRTIRTPVRAPRANAFIERWIGTVHRELLDRILVVNRQHLERVLPVYIRHYNEHRPHRSLNQRPPIEDRRQGQRPTSISNMFDAETCSTASSTNTKPRRNDEDQVSGTLSLLR